MQIRDIDWRSVLDSWTIADLLYLRSIIDEKIAAGQTRRIIIRKRD